MVEHIGQQMKAHKLKMRKASVKDLELMMAWRSNLAVYKGFCTQNAPLTWGEHYNWWKSRKNRNDWIIGLKENGRKRWIGSIALSCLDLDAPNISIYVGETTLWGNGIGRNVLSWVIEWLKKNKYRQAMAYILKENTDSQKMFESIGFHKVGEGQYNDLVYEWMRN